MAVDLLSTALREETAFSDYGLHLWASYWAQGWLRGCTNRATSPSVEKAPQLEIWFFSVFAWFPFGVFSCPNSILHFHSLSFSSLCLSTERDPSPLCLHHLFSLPVHNHAPMARQGVPVGMSLSLCSPGSWNSKIQNPLASTLVCLRNEGILGAPTSPPQTLYFG